MKPVPASALVNAFEFEEAANAKLAPALFEEIAGGNDRRPFDRITLRPRMMVNTRKLDLSQELFGVRYFAPILAGTVPSRARLHSDAEAQLERGTTAARTVIVGAATDANPKILSVNVPGGNWDNFKKLKSTRQMPILVRGMSVNLAKEALSHGASGFLITQSWRAASTEPHPMELLVPVVDAVGARIPVLIGGGFRRGTDILMALALGAKAVVVTRPVAWALAAYGAEGVQTLLELLQTELARDMAMCGKVTLAELDRSLVKIHKV